VPYQGVGLLPRLFAPLLGQTILDLDNGSNAVHIIVMSLRREVAREPMAQVINCDNVISPIGQVRSKLRERNRVV
jgi:hypothetical protein